MAWRPLKGGNVDTHPDDYGAGYEEGYLAGLEHYTQPANEHRMMVKLLKQDLAQAARTLGTHQARDLVRLYYRIQKMRLAAMGQVRAGLDPEKARKDHVAAPLEQKPHFLVQWVAEEFQTVEGLIAQSLGAWAETDDVGRWCLAQHGIGPVFAAGFASTFDPRRSNTAGGYWRFAGYDPTLVWGKGQKRPWNADAKVLVYRWASVQERMSSKDGNYYGKLLQEKKEQLRQQNEEGRFRAAAAEHLEKTKGKWVREDPESRSEVFEPGVVPPGEGKDEDHVAKAAKDWWSKGLLTPAHLRARAYRWTGKLFLAHLFEVGYWYAHGRRAPRPYVIEHLGHAHPIEAPHAPWRTE